MNRRKGIIIGVISVLGIVLGFSIYLLSGRDTSGLKILSPISHSFSILAFANKREPPNRTVYGYLPYWTINDAKHIQMDKITDLAYFGLHIDAKGDFLKVESGETVPGYNNWVNNEELDKVIKKAKDYGVRVALTVISHNDEVSDKFLDCRECWTTLAENTASEMEKKGIKDVNLNFEYVEYTPKEKARQYTQFTQFMNEYMDKRFEDSKLVVSTFADSVVKDRVTNIEEIGKVSDQVFIMAYDFHRPNSDNAGPVAPIGGKGVHAEYDIETMIKDYLAFIPPNKLLLGVPYYGYNWVVESDESYAQRLSGNDDIGYSQSQTYSNIMETILLVKPEIKWDELGKTPYFIYTSPETGALREVYFDNTQSLKEKYNLVIQNDLAGIGIWALGYDGGYRELWNLIEEMFIK